MSEPRRLLGGGEASDFEKELLQSWDVEQPSAAARAGVLAAVGIGAGAATAAAVKLSAAAGGSIAPKATVSVGAAVAAKWAAVAIGVAVAGAGVGYWRHSVTASHASTSVVPRSAPGIATAAAAAAPAPSTPIEIRADVLAEAPADAPHVRSGEPRGGRATPRAHPSALGEQVSALDSARRAMAGGDPASALRQLDDYEARFRDGALVEEAEVLRVEALLAEGDRASASRVADRFLAAHPNSPHAARVRALVASP